MLPNDEKCADTELSLFLDDLIGQNLRFIMYRGAAISQIVLRKFSVS